MPYGYADLLQQVHQQQAQRRLIRPQFPAPAPFPPAAPQEGGDPLAGLQDSVAGVLNSADPRHPIIPGPGGTFLRWPGGYREPSVAGAMVKGALVGAGSWYVWRRMQRRRQVKGELTSPGWRALGLLLGFPVIGFLLSMIWLPETGWLFGGGVILGAVSFVVYMAYRAAGGGRYNTRRRGSPWRSDHQQGGHRGR